MRLTKAYAKMLADLLPAADKDVFRAICGKGEKQVSVTPESIDYLEAMELVKRARSIEEQPRDLILLTGAGKKVAEFV